MKKNLVLYLACLIFMLKEQAVPFVDGDKHPLLDVFAVYGDTIARFNTGIHGISPVQGKHEYIRNHFGFMADALRAYTPFELSARGLVSLWTSVYQTFSESLHTRYAFAKVLIATYATQDLPHLQQFPKTILQLKRDTSTRVCNDADLEHMQQKLNAVYGYLDDIYVAIYGISRSSVFALTERMYAGEKDAMQEMVKLAALGERETPLLAEVQENISTGLAAVRWYIEYSEFIEQPLTKK